MRGIALAHRIVEGCFGGFGALVILGSQHASSGLSTRQDIKPCEPLEDAPRLPAA